MVQAETLSELIARNRDADRTITFIDSDAAEHTVTFGQLYDRAIGLLHSFQSSGLKQQDKLILFLTDNERFLEAYWAAILGGIVPVPVAVGLSDEHRHKLLRIASRLGSPWIYTDKQNLERLQSFASASGLEDALREHANRIVPFESVGTTAGPGLIADVCPDDVCFIQFSSGSTSEPKGIVLTHRNILTNIAGSTEAAGFHDEDVSLSWMPLTHDMGLIGFHLTMFMNQISQTIMATDLFIRRASKWIEVAARTRATILCSPNFGYKHLLKRFDPEKQKDVDLSSVRLIFNGAEPISLELCNEFLDAMGPLGLSRKAMYPVYGLAEASLAVSFPEPGAAIRSIHVDRNSLGFAEAIAVSQDDDHSVELVSVGRAIPNCEVRISDKDNGEIAPGTVGRILIRGGNVTDGYFEDPEATAEAIRDGWLDTGDLGFIDEGDLFIAGRAKDIIFVNGQNYYPNDIENIAIRASGVELGKIAVAGHSSETTGTDDLLVFVIHRGKPDEFLEIESRITKQINKHTGLEVAHVIPVRQIPKTTSGKIQRRILEKSFADGELDDQIAEIASLRDHSREKGPTSDGSDIETRLMAICQEAVPEKAFDRQTNLFELGMSSLVLIQIFGEIDDAWPDRLDITDLFDYPTIAELAEFLSAQTIEA